MLFLKGGKKLRSSSCVVVILTFNSEVIIRDTIQQALKVSREIFVIDSGSTDKTLEIIKELGCTFIHREFVNYGDQRNWAIEHMAHYDWQLHLDADEVLDGDAVISIKNILFEGGPKQAYMIKRRDYFMGKMLKHSGLNPWHLRLFRSGSVNCEDRLYDQHFITNKECGLLNGFLHDKNSLSVSEWISRHNRWSDLEVREFLALKNNWDPKKLEPKFFGDPRERTRALKLLYYKLPVGSRSASYFIYRYFICLGFLDGRPGFYFALFQALWFRVLVDAKIDEARSKSNLN